LDASSEENNEEIFMKIDDFEARLYKKFDRGKRVEFVDLRKWIFVKI
jgi:cold shock CspA family protein